MNANLGKTTFTREEIDDLRDRLKAHREKHGLSWADLAQVTGVAQGTLSTWIPGRYNNEKYWENQEVPARVHRFFLSLAEKEQLEAAMPAEPDFQITASARRMLTCLAMAQLGDMALISAPPGCSKTATATQYAATHAQVFQVTCKPSTRGVNTLLIAILGAMGERDAKGTPQALSARVTARVRNANALILIDEAQHLSAQALDEIRGIHDDTGCGVALIGDETLLASLRKYPQLYSRFGIRHTQNRPLVEDITAIAVAWGIRNGAELAFLHDIGRKTGALRAMTKTIRLAIRGARAGGAPMEVADLRDAYAQRYGETA